MATLTVGDLSGALGAGTTGFFNGIGGSLSGTLHAGSTVTALMEAAAGILEPGSPAMIYMNITGDRVAALANIESITVNGTTRNVILPPEYNGSATTMGFQHMDWTVGANLTVDLNVAAVTPTYTNQTISDTNNDGYFVGSGSATLTEIQFSPSNTPVWRFTGFNIPKGAVIKYAQMRIATRTITGTPMGSTLRVVTTNLAALSGGPTLADLPFTEAGTSFVPSTTTNNFKTADITAAMQEAVNGAGWLTANAIGVLMPESTGTSNATMHDYTTDPAQAARLIVWWVPGVVAPVVQTPANIFATEDVQMGHLIKIDKAASFTSASITGGADATLFSVTPVSNGRGGYDVALRWVTLPDYDAPGDVGTNNVYDVQVTINDSDGFNVVQNLTVTVQRQAVYEPKLHGAWESDGENFMDDALAGDLKWADFATPIFPPSFNFAGDDPLALIHGSGSQASILVQADQDVTWSIRTPVQNPASLDGALFWFPEGNVSPAMGFKEIAWRQLFAAWYSRPKDSNTDNMYEFVVRATSDASGLWVEHLVNIEVIPAANSQDPVPAITSTYTIAGGTGNWLKGTDAALTGNELFEQDGENAISANIAKSTGLMSNQVSQVLRARGFDFSSIPDGATIRQIKLYLWLGGTIGSAFEFANARLAKHSAGNETDWISDNQAAAEIPTAPMPEYSGGFLDLNFGQGLWGASPMTGAQLKTGILAVDMQFRQTNGSSHQMMVDHIYLGVEYDDVDPEIVDIAFGGSGSAVVSAFHVAYADGYAPVMGIVDAFDNTANATIPFPALTLPSPDGLGVRVAVHGRGNIPLNTGPTDYGELFTHSDLLDNTGATISLWMKEYPGSGDAPGLSATYTGNPETTYGAYGVTLGLRHFSDAPGVIQPIGNNERGRRDGSNYSIPISRYLASGTITYIICASRDNSLAFTTPSGWTLVRRSNNGQINYAIFSRYTGILPPLPTTGAIVLMAQWF